MLACKQLGHKSSDMTRLGSTSRVYQGIEEHGLSVTHSDPVKLFVMIRKT